MKKAITVSLLFMLGSFSFAQTKITPGSKLINPSVIHQGKFNMTYYHSDVAEATELGSYEVDVQIKEGKFYLNTLRNMLRTDYEEKENVVAEANSLKAISRKSSTLDNKVRNDFSVENGAFTNQETGKKTNFDPKLADQYFDYNLYPYVLTALPLKLGGENYILPIIDIDRSTNKVTTDEAIVLETKSDQFTSPITGQHMVWKLTVVHKNAKKYIFYYIDKENRRIRKIEHAFKDKVLGFLDKETDVNLFKTVFDRESTRKMMNDGSSIILGEAFAKDDRSGKDDKKIRLDVLNVNKKQYAPKGTKVLLLPHTTYYKERFDLNKKQANIKGAKPIPLPNEAASQIKIGNVFDDKGSFEFANLMPGEYLLFTSFGYEDFFSKTEVVGKADVYVNGSYQGTEVYTDMFGYTQQGNANFYKFVTIDRDGETIKVKLRR